MVNKLSGNYSPILPSVNSMVINVSYEQYNVLTCSFNINQFVGGIAPPPSKLKNPLKSAE